MQITDERINEFIKLYAEEFGEELSIAEAREVASNLCNLYELLLSPTPEELKAQGEAERAERDATQPPTSRSLGAR